MVPTHAEICVISLKRTSACIFMNSILLMKLHLGNFVLEHGGTNVSDDRGLFFVWELPWGPSLCRVRFLEDLGEIEVVWG